MWGEVDDREAWLKKAIAFTGYAATAIVARLISVPTYAATATGYLATPVINNAEDIPAYPITVQGYTPTTVVA